MHTAHLDKSRQVPGGAWSSGFSSLAALGRTYSVSER
jgi:hypothetical protein